MIRLDLLAFASPDNLPLLLRSPLNFSWCRNPFYLLLLWFCPTFRTEVFYLPDEGARWCVKYRMYCVYVLIFFMQRSED